MADPTITVTNLGEAGVETVFGVIYPPQVALGCFGAVVERPWAQDGLVGARRVVTSTLSADHRVTDGHRGARFLATIHRLLKARAAMNADEASKVIAKVLGQIAPEVDLTIVDPGAELRQEVDRDSMDFLNLVTGIHDMTGIDVPERDYPILQSLEGCVRYLVQQSSVGSPGA